MDTQYAYFLKSSKQVFAVGVLAWLLSTMAFTQDTQPLQTPAYVSQIFDFSKEYVVFSGYKPDARCPVSGFQDSSLWIYNRETQEVKQLIGLPTTASPVQELYFAHALLSPDGQTIYVLFYDNFDDYQPLYKLTAPDYALTVLSDDPEVFSSGEIYVYFAMSPDGTKFVLSSVGELGENWQANLITLDGSNVTITPLEHELEIRRDDNLSITIFLKPYFSASGEVLFEAKSLTSNPLQLPSKVVLSFEDFKIATDADLQYLKGWTLTPPFVGACSDH